MTRERISADLRKLADHLAGLDSGSPEAALMRSAADALAEMAGECRGEPGQFLKGLRASRGLTLRDVERITEGKISNAYLSQLENGKIKSPSAIMLHQLSAAYAVDYKELAEKAGFIKSEASPEPQAAGEWNAGLEAAAKLFEPSCSCPEPCDDYWIWPSPCATKAAAQIRALRRPDAAPSRPATPSVEEVAVRLGELLLRSGYDVQMSACREIARALFAKERS
jgi:transcriptional regulator with XRE-family HTH domain